VDKKESKERSRGTGGLNRRDALKAVAGLAATLLAAQTGAAPQTPAARTSPASGVPGTPAAAAVWPIPEPGREWALLPAVPDASLLAPQPSVSDQKRFDHPFSRPDSAAARRL
jgi:hypothetical protein